MQSLLCLKMFLVVLNEGNTEEENQIKAEMKSNEEDN